MPGLFARLFTYRSRKDRSPYEDFFTEALAGVLNASEALRREFVERLFKVVEPKVKCTVQSVALVDTQRMIDGSERLDMWLDAKDETGVHHLIVLENKIDAPEGHRQLTRYATHLAKRGDAASRTLVYITPHERTEFRPGGDGPAVGFGQWHWFQVYDWLQQWVGEHDQAAAGRTGALANELLTLMEDWNMDMNLSAADLATATTYKQTAQTRLIQILRQVRDACKTKLKLDEGKWSYDTNTLEYSSPWIGDKSFYIQFGFDFGRDDEIWSVARLNLPSAYFAIRGEEVSQQDWSALSSDWGSTPDDWNWWADARVKRLDSIVAGGSSMRNDYLEFFMNALDEIENAIPG